MVILALFKMYHQMKVKNCVLRTMSISISTLMIWKINNSEKKISVTSKVKVIVKAWINPMKKKANRN